VVRARGPEAFIGTDPADPCPDDATDDAWPTDFDMNTTVNIIDVLFFLTPILPGGGTTAASTSTPTASSTSSTCSCSGRS